MLNMKRRTIFKVPLKHNYSRWNPRKVKKTPKKIVQINMNYNVPEEQLSPAFMELAPTFAAVDGLEWKVWLIDQEKKTCGGIYLFKDGASAKAYLDSELYAGVQTHPALSGVETKAFDVLPEHSKITRGPI